MRGAGGPAPRAARVKAGTTIMVEGAASGGVVLVLDGMVQVEAGGTALAELGPRRDIFRSMSLPRPGRRAAQAGSRSWCRRSAERKHLPGRGDAGPGHAPGAAATGTRPVG